MNDFQQTFVRGVVDSDGDFFILSAFLHECNFKPVNAVPVVEVHVPLVEQHADVAQRVHVAVEIDIRRAEYVAAFPQVVDRLESRLSFNGTFSGENIVLHELVCSYVAA